MKALKWITLAVAIVALAFGIMSFHSGLSEEDVRTIAFIETQRQFANINELTVSELKIVNKEGEVVAYFYTMLNGAGAMNLRNGDGRIVAELVSDRDGNPSFLLSNAYGEYVIGLFAPGGDGHLFTTDKYGRSTFSTP